ncbi:sensor histidine kinase [Clostridium oceanicum]|uniref:ATP-binding protein n=1 Tax=Clostridium oceanicum TaxID=1543 RepID=A0ABN1JFH4_9CLOT
MKFKYKEKQIIFLVNQLLVISFLIYRYIDNKDGAYSSVLSLSVISIMIVTSSYIQFNNLKENVVLSEFSNLLLFLSWIFLLLRSDLEIIEYISFLLYIFLPYKVISFLLVFIFQNSSYKNRKLIDGILKGICFITVLSMLNLRIFYLMLSVNWLFNYICLFYLLCKNKKRVNFVFKSEGKNIIYSIAITLVPFIIYGYFFRNSPDYMGNIGLYIITSLIIFSIYGVIQNNFNELNQYFSLNSRKNVLLCIVVFVTTVMSGVLFHFNAISYFILIHFFIFIALFYLTLLYDEINYKVFKEEKEDFNRNNYNFYINNLIRISKEEEIKKDFSNYLHDEILQDLLSIKNMMYKIDKPKAKDIIIETLEQLNKSIRQQMEEYHPIILKDLTFKENISNLIDMIRETYKNNICIFLECNEDLFLVEPYNISIYRILKELITNSFKHSNCKRIFVSLFQKREEIKVIVEDDGIGFNNIDIKDHHGLSSIKEQVDLLNGNLIIKTGKLGGISVIIEITMRGDNSYEYFINR